MNADRFTDHILANPSLFGFLDPPLQRIVAEIILARQEIAYEQAYLQRIMYYMQNRDSLDPYIRRLSSGLANVPDGFAVGSPAFHHNIFREYYHKAIK